MDTLKTHKNTKNLKWKKHIAYKKAGEKPAFYRTFFLKTICHVFRFIISYAPLVALDVTAVVEMIVAVDAFVALVAHHQNVVQVLDVLPVVHLKHSYPDQNLVPVVDAVAKFAGLAL